MKDKRKVRLRTGHIFIILALVCVALIIASSLSPGINNTLRNGIDTVLMPMQNALNRVAGAAFSGIENLRELSRTQEEYDKLLEEVQTLREQNTKYQLRLNELEQLQGLLEISEQYPDYEMTAAHIISKNSGNWYETFKIDKGAADGVQVNMNIMAQGGLAGIVTSVETNTSTVQAIIDDNCSVSGMASVSGASCIVTGDLLLYQDGMIMLDHIDKNDDIKDGYKIVTSNTSSVYLPGLLIGYAQDLTVDANSLTMSGHLIPAVDFSKLDTVMVVMTLKQTEG